MKTIIKSESIQEFKSYFDNLSNVCDELTLWQVNSSTSEREIVKVKYDNYNFELDIISFTHSRPDLSFLENDIYFYCSELKFIFKGQKSEVNQNIVQIYAPNEIKVLDDSEIDSFSAGLHVGFTPNKMSEHTVIEGVTESFTHENFEFDSEQEHISTDYDVHDSTVDHLKDVNLSGSVGGTDHMGDGLSGSTAGTDQLNTSLKGHASTENLSTSMSGKTYTSENLSTSMVGKGKTEHQNTRVDAKGKTEHTSSTVATKTQEEYEQSQRDKDIFETELSFISLDDEDAQFADKRDAPRARPKKGKMISMKVQGTEQEEETHELFDLSRGGLGVICFNEERYHAGDIIEIFSFDSNVLDAPMLSIVRSVREADETRTSFKIGMQFYKPDN
jgi:hypothetical protein